MSDSKEQVIEQILGTSIDLVDWRKKMKEGFLVTLRIQRWRARKRLSLSELGIKPPTVPASAAYEELLTLGSKLLLPLQTLKDLDAIERGARIHLKNFTYETPFGTFIPYTSYRQWKSGNEQFKERFYAKRDEIVSEYPALVEQVLSEYDQIARHTYQLLCTQDAEFTQIFPHEEAFLLHFRTEVIARNIKTAEEFAATFVYDEQFSRIQLLDSLEAEELDTEGAENVITQKQAEIEAAQKRRVMLEEMNRDLVRKAREQKEAMIDGFLTSLIVQMRSLTYDAVTSVLQSIKQQDTLQGRPAFQLKHLVEQIQQMNFYGDQDIDGILTTLYSIIEKPSKERDISEIKRQLKAIATVTRSTILSLGESPRDTKEVSPQDLEISPIPDEEEIREAREEINAAVTNYTLLMEETNREEREEREEGTFIPTREEIREARE
jgi:hypothetical protein